MSGAAVADPGAAGARPHDPHRVGHGDGRSASAAGRGTGGPAPKRIVVAFGFWVFIVSDIILFATFFAAYAVLAPQTAGGPAGAQLLDLGNAGLETACLLLSSYACGIGSLGAKAGRRPLFFAGMAVAFGLGAAFLVLEMREFDGLVARGAGPDRSAFLSSFFALVGCHGCHVALGLAWLATMMAQVATLGFTAQIRRRLLCFSLFWHALDVVWIGILTVVYLMALR